jgi:integrase/recombinase XerD
LAPLISQSPSKSLLFTQTLQKFLSVFPSANLRLLGMRTLGFVGSSSHRGRRGLITQAARKVSLVGGSLRDVQALAGRASLTTTGRYIEMDAEAQSRLVNIV